MEELLIQACKNLRFNTGIVAKAKKIKADTHLDFLLKLFVSEAEDRDRKRRNTYQKEAKFDIVKTFEKYTFEDIKFPQSLTADDIMECSFIPKRENLILYGNWNERSSFTRGQNPSCHRDRNSRLLKRT